MNARQQREAAATRLLSCYGALAQRHEHLLYEVTAGTKTMQWEHWPADDAVDEGSGYQWFYHSHAPEDRQAGAAKEHGHFHLFARADAWTALPSSLAEADTLRLLAGSEISVSTRHLLCISLDAKGVPFELFTVNSWVTGDSMLDAASTEWLLAKLKLSTGHGTIDAVLESLITLCAPQLHALLASRDTALQARAVVDNETLFDRSLEVLSSYRIDLDEILASVLTRPG